MNRKTQFFQVLLAFVMILASLKIMAQPTILIEYINVPADKLSEQDAYQTEVLAPYHQKMLDDKKLYAWYHYATRFPTGNSPYNRVNVTVLADEKYKEEHDAPAKHLSYLWDLEIAKPDYQLRSSGYGTVPVPYVTVDFLKGLEGNNRNYEQYLKTTIQPALDKKVRDGRLLNWSVFRFKDKGKRPKKYDGVIVSRYKDFSSIEHPHPLEEKFNQNWIKSEAWKTLNLVYKKSKVLTKEEQEIKAAIMRFIESIDSMEDKGVAISYADAATAFYPHSFAQRRLDGKTAIMTIQQQGFEAIRQALPQNTDFSTVSLQLKPQDFNINILGETIALVTWHSPRPNHIMGRRTAVMQKIKGKWLILHMHASNMGL